ncbi:hypothetical protein BLOT_002259, partial [Blomia tropicalis]
NWPYADRLNDRYEGFIVDLMNLIGKRVDFSYQLYFSPDGKYGSEHNGHINGMIGEVFKNKADFAIADLTVTHSRKRYVDFTEPFMENQLSAIIRRDDAVGLRTLEDLVTKNEITRGSDMGLYGSRHAIAFGTYRTGSTFHTLKNSNDPIAIRMYSWMIRNPNALVGSAKEGFDRVNAGRYAFIVESTFAEYLSGLYCNLTTLYDTRQLYPRQFAIALPKGSPHLEAFNEAIRELKANGEIERLRQLYWANRCQQQQSQPPQPQNTNSAIQPIVAQTNSVVQTIPNVDAGNRVVPDLSLSIPSTSATARRGNSETIDLHRNGNSIEPINIEWNSNNHRQVEPINHRTLQPPTSINSRRNYDDVVGNGYRHGYKRYHQRGSSIQTAAFSSADHCSIYWTPLILCLLIYCDQPKASICDAGIERENDPEI